MPDAVDKAKPELRLTFRQHSQGPLVSQVKNAIRELEVDIADLEP